MSPQFHAPEQLRRERALWSRAVDGDRAAWGELYDLFAETLYRQVVFPVVGEAAAAEDVLADTFRIAYQRASTYEAGSTSVFFWLARIAKNRALDLHRASSVTGRALTRLEGYLASETDAGGTPEEQLSLAWDGAMTQKRIAALLAELNPRYRRAIELRFFEERSREECAEALEVKVGTFDVLILRALRSFREQWVQRHGAPEGT